MPLTEAEVQEARRLATDFSYFAENFLWIKTKEKGLIPFRFNKAQRHLWKQVAALERDGKPVRVIILKARQLGMSTFVQGYLLWKAITQSGTNGLVVSHLKDHASRLFGKLELMYERLPEEMLNELESIRDTRKKGLYLVWGGDQLTSIHVDTAGNKNLGRGDTINYVHLSEIAFYDDAEEIVFGLNSSVPNGARSAVFLESTANGMGNYFYRQWKRATAGESGYVPVFMPWFWDESNQCDWGDDWPPITPDERELMAEHGLTRRQIAWRRTAIEDECDGDVEKFKQENPASPREAFLISGRPFFDRHVVRSMREAADDAMPIREGIVTTSLGKPTFDEYPGGEWRIYERPQPSRHYAIGADVASGTSRDFSAAHIIDSTSLEVVASFRGKMDEDEFALQLKFMGLAYGTALIAVERNNSGRACLLALQRMQYPRLFYHQHSDEWSGGVKQVWGWSTNTKSRPVMLAQLSEAIRRGELGLKDVRTIEELGSFVHTGAKPQAAKGAFDDMVMSLAIAVSEEVRGQAISWGEDFVYDESKPTTSSITGY